MGRLYGKPDFRDPERRARPIGVLAVSVLMAIVVFGLGSAGVDIGQIVVDIAN